MEIIETIIETRQGSIKVVKYNKPSRKNAIDENMYLRVMNILNSAATDDDISVMVLTGSGDFYSSGNDFTAMALKPPLESNFKTVLYDYIKAFITFPKLLVAIVNGPAIGIAATTLALCDLVFASENSYFYTPFTKLGIVAEGCSTFTFPRLIGERKEIQSEVWDKIAEVSKLPTHSVSLSKKLLKGVLQDELLSANKTEIHALTEIWKVGLNESNRSKL
ncbi:Crotonobetainyl-CoA-hydratase [Operophtera brumata]|uniref:Crotonobetainyl-CoA-hydratase n=1 Tax=Operophtera brumata TaxID=104452 RepID=A0A0L7LRB9_OPEBR|nr:Crotonobetainyl-CoA-hydratase [Operophtera brumata]